MKPKRSLLERTVIWTSVIFGICIVVTCNLSNHVDAFKCDIVHGSDHLPGWSNSKEEAIKRKTYFCDVILNYESFDNDKTYDLKPLKGWVESSWRTGFWYLTTKKDTGKDISYRIVVPNSGDKRRWIVRNPAKGSYGEDVLNYDTGYPPDQFEALKDKLPSSDTLYYNVLKKDTIDFRPENIKGRIKIILLRKSK
ncbi:MAG: hypothetical protein JST50_14530 [Bacteroidetes bacterium]|jgi:hypothetical protein|nr:hypothetical protein [Bacteroidota bacterium]